MGKITDEELQSINDLRKQTAEVVTGLGEIEYQKNSLKLLKAELKNKIGDLKSKESQLLGELKDKYGNVNINIETGEF